MEVPLGKRLQWRPKHRWEDIIKIYLLRSRICCGPDWTGLVNEQIAYLWRRQWTLLLITLLFWDITQRIVEIYCRCFGTTYLYHLQVSLKMGPVGCPETSVINCQYSLRNIPEERSSNLLRGGRLKSNILVPWSAVRSRVQKFPAWPTF